MNFLYRPPCGYGSLQGGGCDGAGRKITVDLGRGRSNATQIGHGLPRQYVPRKGALVPVAFGTARFAPCYSSYNGYYLDGLRDV